MSDSVWTVGYQGASVGRLLEALREAGVAVLMDVREAPTSRRAGFRKGPLGRAVEEGGLRYRSGPALGAPKELRDLHDTQWPAFAAGYRERLLMPGVRAEVDRLVELIGSERVCLLCYEADPAVCHRTLLAEEVAARTGVAVVALRPVAAVAK